MMPPELQGLKLDSQKIDFQNRCFALMGENSVHTADCDEVIYHPQYGLFVVEYTKVSKARQDKGFSPWQSDPNKFWNDSYDGRMHGNKGKFIYQYQVARSAGARYFIIAYGEASGAYADDVRVNEVAGVFQDSISFKNVRKYKIDEYASLYVNFMKGISNNGTKLKELYSDYSLDELGCAEIYNRNMVKVPISEVILTDPDWVKQYPQIATADSKYKAFNVPVVNEYLVRVEEIDRNAIRKDISYAHTQIPSMRSKEALREHDEEYSNFVRTEKLYSSEKAKATKSKKIRNEPSL